MTVTVGYADGRVGSTELESYDDQFGDDPILKPDPVVLSSGSGTGAGGEQAVSQFNMEMHLEPPPPPGTMTWCIEGPDVGVVAVGKFDGEVIERAVRAARHVWP